MRKGDHMERLIKKVLLAILVTILFLEDGMTSAQASSKSTVTVEKFIRLMIVTSKIEVDITEKVPYIAAALREGIIKEGEFSSYKVKVTYQDAAVIACRTEELLHGRTYDESLYSQIKNKKRISDLNKIIKSKQSSVIKVFSKGIMIGFSNGRYSHSRQFKGAENIPLSTAKLICNRTVNKSKRRKLSPDGQLIRETNLPKSVKNKNAPVPSEDLPYVVKGTPSAKDYPYILESFPNDFYQKSFDYQNTRYGAKPVELVKYASPAKLTQMNHNGYKMDDVLAANLDTWVNKIETNLEKRLNVDYRTIDNDWMNDLRKTYFIYDDANMDKYQTTEIKNYMKVIKKNKVIVTGKVSVESSTLYRSGTGYYMRAFVKFKIVSGNNLNAEKDAIFGHVYLPNFKKGVWYKRYIDIRLGSNNGGSKGDDIAVSRIYDTIY